MATVAGRLLADAEQQEARVTLAVTAIATLLVLVDFTALLSTAHATAADLRASVAGSTWALSAMSLGLAAGLLTAGAVADDLGRRRVLRGGAVALAVATAGAAAAPSMGAFVAARVAQGLAGACLLAAALGMIGHAFPAGADRTRATGIWGAMVGGGIALGPLLGGVIGDVAGWRSVHGLLAALALGLAAAAGRASESRSDRPRAIDVAGALTLAVSASALTAGFVTARDGWTSPTTLALLAVGILALAAFGRTELRRADPMVDLALLRTPLFVASIGGALVTGVSLIATMSYLPTLLQEALGLSALGSAAVLAAWSAASMAVAWNARRLPAKISTLHRLAVGFALSTAGLVAVAQLSVSDGWLQLIPGLVVAGVGTGLVNAALGRLAVASVPANRPGMGSGANNTARYVGGAAGIALVVAVAAGGGRTPAALVHGWDRAARIAAAISAAGAVGAATLARASVEG
ncbi:Drug efflux pump JefA [Baekduia alba]|uniref:MFS transporter n=1 Tax=Baekduia alba TaxID=2997333 RepID=UPI00233F82FE|nr:MFS transporter [Baekduia alba]WCB96731.1 Drug efflux pump JefA [Baekduia alba]